MAIVTDINVLLDRQVRMDTDAYSAAIKKASDDHPSLVAAGEKFLGRSQRLIGSNHVGDCAECGDAAFLIRDSLSGRTEPRCRCCYNSIMRQTLGHQQYNQLEICWPCCELRYDSLGLLFGVTHVMKPLEDVLVREERSHLATQQEVDAALENAKLEATAAGTRVEDAVSPLILAQKIIDKPSVISGGIGPLLRASRIDLTDDILSILDA